MNLPVIFLPLLIASLAVAGETNTTNTTIPAHLPGELSADEGLNGK